MALSTTSTQIVNRALAAIGQTTGLTDLVSDNTNVARQARLVYDDCVEDVLAAVEWNFNSKRVQLPEADSKPLFDFAYQYPLPDDCVKVRELWDSRFSQSVVVAVRQVAQYDSYGHERWRVETIGEKETDVTRVLVCDFAPPCSIVYSWRNTALQRWSGPARSALIAHLAAQLAMPIAQKESLATKYEKKFETIIAQAASIDAQEASETMLDDGSWVDARDGY